MNTYQDAKSAKATFIVGISWYYWQNLKQSTNLNVIYWCATNYV